ncbi:MAG: OmpA family protein [Geminicoccaceae bacterium]
MIVAVSCAAGVLTGCVDYFTADRQIDRAKELPADSDTYQGVLRSEYIRYAEAEYAEFDFRDAAFFASRASRADQGSNLPPQDIAERHLPQDDMAELSDARSRLIAALEGNATQRTPAISARTQAAFDCWIQEQEEDIQPEDIEACKRDVVTGIEQMEAALAAVSEAAAAAQIADGITVEGDFLFGFDSAEISDEGRAELDRVAQLIRESGSAAIIVQGHTDSVGPEIYNQGLSERRAQTVANHLMASGVSRDTIAVEGAGETQPVASNDTAEGRAQNRRVVIVSE